MCVVLCKSKSGQNLYFFLSIIKDRKWWRNQWRPYLLHETRSRALGPFKRSSLAFLDLLYKLVFHQASFATRSRFCAAGAHRTFCSSRSATVLILCSTSGRTVYFRVA